MKTSAHPERCFPRRLALAQRLHCVPGMTNTLMVLMLAVNLLSMKASAVEPGVRLDANVLSSSGEPVQLASLWGKPVLFFYESPDTSKLNQPAKEELKRLADHYQLKKLVDTIAVANLEGLDWWPARPIAFGVVRGEEAKAQLPILVDLNGALRKGPWKLDPKTPTVMVISPGGEVLFQASGKLEGERLEALKSTLRQLLTTLASAQ